MRISVADILDDGGGVEHPQPVIPDIGEVYDGGDDPAFLGQERGGEDDRRHTVARSGRDRDRVDHVTHSAQVAVVRSGSDRDELKQTVLAGEKE